MIKGSIRVLLVDDHMIVRQSLAVVLARLPGIQAVAETGSCREALELIAAHPPEVVIMDAHLPEINGVEGTRRILAQNPGIKVIMLSGDSSASLILDALRVGVSAYLIKENSPEELARAIEAVMAGKGYFSPEVAATIARYCRENPLAVMPAKPLLSDQEKRLLQLIAQGKRNKEIATDLNVATKSVEAYRSRLMAKLGCSSPAELTRFAIREGIAAL